MSRPSDIYKPSLALLTDLYQLTMGYGYFKAGLAEREAAFHLFFRKNPFEGGYAIAAGLADAVDLLEHFAFAPEDLAYLETLEGNDGKPLFSADYLDYLGMMRPALSVKAMPEGTVAFRFEPLLRVEGPLIQAQIVETALLCIVGFQTLIATKAARICRAAQGQPVLEFGLRRAQGIDGALAASRAAHIGGCAATSNVLAGKLYGIPVKGTHAHSWVMAFADERTAFEQYAAAMPNNCVFLVDTYDTLEGVRRAVEVGKKLRAQGHEMAGIRLDSGDLHYLSAEARRILDEGGFPDAAIVASNDLDEHLIESLAQQGARITVWGVGTKLTTAFDQPALGAVYKLTAIKGDDGAWQHRVKLSEQAVKVSNPGLLQVRRYTDGPHGCVADVIYDELDPPAGAGCVIVDPLDSTRRRRIEGKYEDLLVPVFEQGRRLWDTPPLAEIRARAQDQLARFHDGIKRLPNPHAFPVGLEASLNARKTRLILQARPV